MEKNINKGGPDREQRAKPKEAGARESREWEWEWECLIWF